MSADIRPGEILRTTVGSEVHGVTVGSDDHDEMGIFIPDPHFVLGLDHVEQYQWRTQPEGVRSGAGDIDLVVYTLKKWMNLAVKGNPSILLPLYVPHEHIRYITDLGYELRDLRVAIVSQKIKGPFLGYVKQQRERLLGVRGGKHTNRPELIEQYGFDTKYAYHMVRLAYQGSVLWRSGILPTPIAGPWRRVLLELRRGERTLEWAVEISLELEENFNQPSALPLEPDRQSINEWMCRAHHKEWGWS